MHIFLSTFSLHCYGLHVHRHTTFRQDVHKVDILRRYDNYDKQDDHMHVLDYIDSCTKVMECRMVQVVEESFGHIDKVIHHSSQSDIFDKHFYDKDLRIDLKRTKRR